MGNPRRTRRIVDAMARARKSTDTDGDGRVFSVTTAPQSAALDQSARMRRYLWTMGIRTACFIIAVVASGPLRWVAVGGAAVLPYFAVVLANAVGPRTRGSVGTVTPYVDPTQRITTTAHPNGPSADGASSTQE